MLFRRPMFVWGDVVLVSSLLLGACDGSSPDDKTTSSNPMAQESSGSGAASGTGGKRAPASAGKGGEKSAPAPSNNEHDDAGPGDDKSKGGKAGSSGSGGQESSSQASNPPAWAYGSATCEKCVKMQSSCAKDEKSNWVEYCLNMPDKAKDGPKAGTERAQLCTDLLSCVRKSKCDHQVVDSASGFFLSVFSDCYCGAGVDPFECFTGNADMATGACKREVEAAAETTDTSEIQTRLYDPDYASGVADSVYDLCDAFCPFECEACKPGAMLCSLDYACVPVGKDGKIVLAKPQGCGGAGAGGAGAQAGTSGAGGSK